MTIVHVHTVGLIGFENVSYTVQESAGVASVCVAILEPSADLIDPILIVGFFLETVDGTAEGISTIMY